MSSILGVGFVLRARVTVRENRGNIEYVSYIFAD